MTVFLETCDMEWRGGWKVERTRVLIGLVLYMSKLLNIDHVREKKRLKRSFLALSVKIYCI